MQGATRKSILERKTSVRRFGGGGVEGEDLACDVLKFVFLYRFFCNQQSFSRGIKSNTNKA